MVDNCGRVTCVNCYFSELNDDGCFCNYFDEKVGFDEYCKYYVHTDIMNGVLIVFINEMLGGFAGYTNIYEYIQDFKLGKE